MVKFFRNKQDLIFWLVGASLAVSLLVIIFFSLNFLVRRAADSFGIDLRESQEIVKFNLQKVEELK